MSAEDSKRREYVAGLRALAALIEANTELPLPVEQTFSWQVASREVVMVQQMLSDGWWGHDSPVEDRGSGVTFSTVSRQLHGLTLEIVSSRAVKPGERPVEAVAG